jgi:hypothetical protein
MYSPSLLSFSLAPMLLLFRCRWRTKLINIPSTPLNLHNPLIPRLEHNPLIHIRRIPSFIFAQIFHPACTCVSAHLTTRGVRCARRGEQKGASLNTRVGGSIIRKISDLFDRRSYCYETVAALQDCCVRWTSLLRGVHTKALRKRSAQPWAVDQHISWIRREVSGFDVEVWDAVS